jgi:Uma2 family endonuclease
MTVIINDPSLAARIRAEREISDAASHDEMWYSNYVMSPLPNNLHQRIVTRLILALRNVVDMDAGDQLFAGVNVTDQEQDWTQNFRVPDVAVVLRDNPLLDRETHLLGGPDFVIEVVSPGDQARAKFPFYAGVGVRELLLVDREPWALELYRLDSGELRPGGRSTVEQPDLLASTVLPLAVRLLPGERRPLIELLRADGTQSWTL